MHSVSQLAISKFSQLTAAGLMVTCHLKNSTLSSIIHVDRSIFHVTYLVLGLHARTGSCAATDNPTNTAPTSTT